MVEAKSVNQDFNFHANSDAKKDENKGQNKGDLPRFQWRCLCVDVIGAFLRCLHSHCHTLNAVLYSHPV